MSCTAEELPQELWALILQYVDLKQRLYACALVCRKLARAAAAATQSVSVSCYNKPKQLDAFLAWASSHGSSLTRMYLHSSLNIRQLPCPNLLELELSDCGVQLCARSGGLGLLHCCTALTKLVINYTNLLDGDVGEPAGAAPAETARLQHLELCCVKCAGAQALKIRLFPHLTDLTCLDVGGDVENELLSCFPHHISNMASLQQLRLSDAGPITAATLAGIQRLTALEDLTFSFCDLEPSCLLPMTTGLTRLCLEHVTLQPLEAQQDSALGASQLLLVLARCSILQELMMDDIVGDCPQQLAPYSAQTASSNLQELHIYDSSIPGAALAHVFPAGRKLPNLHAFTVLWHVDSPPAAFDSTAIASCCPALRRSNIAWRYACADASLAPLRSVTALTNLSIGPFSPDVIRSDLTALSQLRSLDMCGEVPSDAGEDASSELQHLVPPTALTGLIGLSSHAGCLSSKAPAGSQPDVWVQLLERCAANQQCQPAVISSVVQHMQQQRHDTGAA